MRVFSPTNRDPEVTVLKSSPGLGEHCVSVDASLIFTIVLEHTRLIHDAGFANDRKSPLSIDNAHYLVAKAKMSMSTVDRKGLPSKQDIDGLLASPALEIWMELSELTSIREVSAKPYIFDVPAELEPRKTRLKVTLAALQAAKMIVGAVAHSLFPCIDQNQLRDKHITETCAVWK